MKIATASDHAGLEMKNIINDFIAEKGYEVLDLGTYDCSTIRPMQTKWLPISWLKKPI